MSPPCPLAAAMAVHLRRLPVFAFLSLLFLTVHGSSDSLPPTYDASIMCPESFWCGSVHVHYPFYLSNTTRYTTTNHTPYSCGYTDLKIFCQGEWPNVTPIISLGDDSYTVLHILYESETIVLADSDVLELGKCRAVSHDVSFDDQWLSFSNSSKENLTFYFSCHPPVPPGSDTYQIDCNGIKNPFGDGPSPSYVFTPDDHDTVVEHELASLCYNLSVPVRSEALTARNRTNITSGGYGDVLKLGFELVWLPRHECYPCEQSGGKCAYNQYKEFMGCLCSNGKVAQPDCTNSGASRASRPRSGRKKKLIEGVSATAASLAVLAFAAFCFIRKRKQRNQINSSSKLLKYSGSGGTPRYRGGDMESGSIDDPPAHLFSYEELEEATNSFDESRELGDGGFGTVYKGYLKDGRVVAVKRLYNSYRRLEQFQNEAAILSGLRHPNLVMFYGCTSCQSRELLLVYEFVANGTIADHLHGDRAAERALSWPLRLNVAVESAAALNYLHAIEPPVVHRDVKTNNILLDADFHVKVADFGLSRLFPLDATHVSTAPQGTPGYVDPEYHQCYQLTDKSDVYSFGVVLVELISSKPAVDITRHRNEINLAGMAVNKIQKCELEDLVDLSLGYETDPATKKMMTMVAELAFRCLQQNSEMRPPMKEVLEVLKSIQGECRVEKDGDKSKDGPFSPTTVHAPWDSRATTPNTSKD